MRINFHRYFLIKDNQIKLGLSILSGILFYLAYPDNDYYLLEWIAFIPLLIAAEKATYKEIYWLSVLMGWIFVCAGYPWITHVAKYFIGAPPPFHYLVWLVDGFYNAQLFGLIFLMYTYLKNHTPIPSVLLFPAITVTLWSFFPNIFYFTLGNGTSGFLTALQATEFTGVFGLDFMVALVNISIYQLIRFPSRKNQRMALGIAAIIISIWFGYGVVSLNQWDNLISNWEVKKIGLVQPHRPASFATRPPEPGYSRTYPLEMDLSHNLAQRGAELIVWPEGHRYRYNFQPLIQMAFQRSIKKIDVPVIFHDITRHIKGDRYIYRNSSLWLRKNGELGGMYHKRFLVPFGEYVPLIQYWPSLIKRFRLPNITPGEESIAFETAGMKVRPLICYEIMFSHFVAESIGEDSQGNVLLVQTNDGWYGPGSQSAQHRTANVLRAVENRVPVVHVINNGESSVVLPNGRYAFLSDFWKLGHWVVDMPFSPDSGGSFFSRYPSLFLNCVRLLTLSFFIVLFLNRKRISKNENPYRSEPTKK